MYLSLVTSQTAKIKRNFCKHLNNSSGSNNLPVKKGGSHWHQRWKTFRIRRKALDSWGEGRPGISCCHWWGSREFKYGKNVRGALENYQWVPGQRQAHLLITGYCDITGYIQTREFPAGQRWQALLHLEEDARGSVLVLGPGQQGECSQHKTASNSGKPNLW